MARQKEVVMNLTLKDRFRWGWLSGKGSHMDKGPGGGKVCRIAGKVTSL